MTPPSAVFALEHGKGGQRKLLGFFPSVETARRAIDKYLPLEGFDTARDGFDVNQMVMGEVDTSVAVPGLPEVIHQFVEAGGHTVVDRLCASQSEALYLVVVGLHVRHPVNAEVHDLKLLAGWARHWKPGQASMSKSELDAVTARFWELRRGAYRTVASTGTDGILHRRAHRLVLFRSDLSVDDSERVTDELRRQSAGTEEEALIDRMAQIWDSERRA